MNPIKFEELELSQEMLQAIIDMGFEEATPIQAQSIQHIKNGFDVLGQSQTGTGKTAAFGIPCLEKIDTSNKNLQTIILCPTRELAIQVCEEFRKLIKYKDTIKILPVYGGQPIDRQITSLKKGVQVIIGTPGRVMDHMRRGTIKLNHVNTIVLDEADEMLDMGFREDIELILQDIPEPRQTVFFSATMPKGILDLTKKYQDNPQHIKIDRSALVVPAIEQYYIELRDKTKLEALCRIIDIQNPKLSIVFCNTKRRVDEVVEHLQSRGYFAEGLHGDLKQAQRDTVMKKFRNGTLEVLVATDVAARGIDVDDIEIVFNYDLPQDAEYYVHRIGRTGRAGRKGIAYTFVVGREIYKLKDIMKYTKAKITHQNPPSLSDIEEFKSKAFVEKVRTTIAEGHLAKYINLVEKLNDEDYSTLDIAAALFKLHLYEESASEIDFSAPSYKSDDTRRGKDSGKKAKKTPPAKDAVRLFMNVGRKDNVSVRDIVGSIANECNVPGKSIGPIDIYDEFCFIDVSEKYVKSVLKGMEGKKIKKRKVSIEKAKRSKN